MGRSRTVSDRIHSQRRGSVRRNWTYTPEEDNDYLLESGCEAWDDVTGLPLDPGGVAKARQEEMQCYRQMNVYDNVPLKQCWDRTGRAPIKVRWVDVDKHKGQGPATFRSRLVACHYNTTPDGSIFAATPPIESLKPAISDEMRHPV